MAALVGVLGQARYMNAGPSLRNGLLQIPIKYIMGVRSEAELALIIAHELAHFLLHHKAEGAISMVMGNFQEIRSVLEERQEKNADNIGFRMFINAGYNSKDAETILRIARSDSAGAPHYSINQIPMAIRLLLSEYEGNLTRYRPDTRKSIWVEHRPKPIHPKIPEEIKSEVRVVLSREGSPWTLLKYYNFRYTGIIK